MERSGKSSGSDAAAGPSKQRALQVHRPEGQERGRAEGGVTAATGWGDRWAQAIGARGQSEGIWLCRPRGATLRCGGTFGWGAWGESAAVAWNVGCMQGTGLLPGYCSRPGQGGQSLCKMVEEERSIPKAL